MFDALSILYIEDNPDDAFVLKEFVTHIPKPIDVEVKSTLLEGLKTLKQQRFDLILIDLSLPDSRGLQSIEKIIHQNNDIPVVALTGFMDKKLAVNAIKIGAQDYLVKGDYNEHVLEKTFSHAIERHKIMKDMLSKQELLEQAQKIAKLGRFIYDYESDSYERSIELVHIFGFSEDIYLASKHYWDAVHFDDIEYVKKSFINHLKTKIPLHLDHRVVTNDDQTKYVRVSFDSEFDKTGHCFKTIGTVQDVSHDYNRNELLRQSQERLDMAVRSGKVGIFDWDLETGEVVCDETLYSIYEVEFGSTVNYTEVFLDRLNPQTKAETLGKLDAAIKGKSELKMDFDIILPSGKLKYLQSLAQFQLKDDKVSRMVGTLIDVTARVEADLFRDTFTKKLEHEVQSRTKELEKTKVELQEALKKEKELSLLKSRFVETASHQFRTPLSVIQSNVELIAVINRSDIDSDLELFNKAEKRIENEVKRMTDLMDDVLILGKMSSNQIPLDIQENDIVTRVKHAAQACQTIQNDGRIVEFNISENPKLFMFDQRTMDHVFENLLSNSFKYSRSRNPNVHIHFNAENCKIEVIDFGIGIPQDEIKSLFQTFYRCSNVGDISGTGLGLSIVKDYVTLNGGQVQAESELGKQTKFTVTLPVNNH